MNLTMRPVDEETLTAATEIWNEVVAAGRAFPQTDALTLDAARRFFKEQSRTAAAIDGDTGEVWGMYILHPNNVGRCGHICNASYAVRADKRGLGVGEVLVRDCMQSAKALGFGILQFNAVVASNTRALALYKKLGFTQLGVIPKGFCNLDGVYEDIIPHYITL
jgi:Acetyltransferases